ncbi:DUF4350 domain-containing protein [Cellulomonas sp. NPDC089187]|uniref:DUF4350 domain-containing protein n=1 Tax=Cellulomonas sp. NPDC089187 TaxID=3154970 RepID=UPI003422924C
MTAVLGDGTTAATRAAGRWQRWRWVLVAVLVAAVAGVAALLPEPRTSATPLAPDNPTDSGGRALAQVLGDQGVEVEYVRTSAAAVAAARPGSTLMVTSDLALSRDQVEALAGTAADLVLLDSPALASAATDGRMSFTTTGPALARHTAQCADPDARAAGAVRAGGAASTGVTGPWSSTLCFPLDDGSHVYGSWSQDDRRIDLIGDALLFSNSRVTEEGNAALALRVLGRHDHLVWYIPALDDLGAQPEPGASTVTSLLPPQALPLGLLSLVVLLTAAIWRGRRLGPVVAERLPVVVRAAETTRGRARLYRRGRAHGHAAAALRAGAADRCARRLGVPSSAAPEHLIDALVRATGRDATTLGALLYGPPPTDDAGLRTLARQLDDLESEVHHP